ncbi:MAG: thiol-activated cytolysin family protein, partial [Bacteroidota bacterium]
PADPPPNQIRYRDTQVEQFLVNGIAVPCTTFFADRTQRISSFDYFSVEDKGELWPGNIVRGKDLREQGRLSSIGSFPRDPMRYTIQGSQGSTSFTVEKPALSTFNTAWNANSRFFWFMPPVYAYQETEITYSAEQAMVDLGINLGFLSSGLGARFQTVTGNGTTTMYMLVKNVYFNVSAEFPSHPAGFFAPEVQVSQLRRVMSADNPPAYVSNVSYGRIALVRLVSKYSQREIKTAVDLSLQGLGASLTQSQKQLISELQLTVEAAPGPSQTIRSMEALMAYINEGSEFNHRNGAVPVSYEVRYLSNNAPLMTHAGLTYKIRECL